MPKDVFSEPAPLVGLKNLSLYGHVCALGMDDKPADQNYLRVLQKDLREAETDTVWLRNQIAQAKVANELLKHQLRLVQTPAQRLKILDAERIRREQETEEDWEAHIAELKQEEAKRERMEEEFLRLKEEDRRRMAEIRKKLDYENRLIGDTKRRIAKLEHSQPVPRGRYPGVGYLVVVNVVNGENLRPTESVPLYVKVGFNVPKSPAVKSAKESSNGDPIWDETLETMFMPEGATHLHVALHSAERHQLLGEGLLDLRSEENVLLPVDIRDEVGDFLGRINIRFFCQNPHPPPPPPGATYGATSASTLDLMVVQARDLVDVDRIGQPDPYAIMCWGTEMKPFYTTKVSSGCNPVWNEGVKDYPVPKGVEFVSVYVFDKDTVGKDDFMGFYRMHLQPAPNGEIWVPLYPREGNKEDLKLLEKANDDLGELHIRVHFHFVPDHGGLDGYMGSQGYVPTRCLLTITGVEGVASLEEDADPYVTMSVGDTEATTAHRISRFWNPAFELFVPEHETVMSFVVYDDAIMGADTFLGQADFDIHPRKRANRSYKLPLEPRPGNERDTMRAQRNKGLGTVNFTTEWVGLDGSAPDSAPATPSRTVQRQGSRPRNDSLPFEA